MSISQISNSGDSKNSKLIEFQIKYFGNPVSSVLLKIFYFNLLFTVMRLQGFPGFSVLGTIRLPLVLTIIVFLGFLSKTLAYKYLKPIKIMLAIIILEGIRGLLGFLILPNLVLNDAWQLHIWQDIIMHLFSIVGPILYICSCGYRFRGMVSFLNFVGFMLGMWSLTHGGRGPGGYLGDENDNCLMLVTLIPISVLYITSTSSFMSKFFGYSTFLVLIGGAIRTISRGGFLGLMAVMMILFYQSKKKLQLILGLIVAIAVISPFIPEEYTSEIKSIRTDATAKKSTIQERFETWGIVFRMWKDPRNTLFGVGLANSKFNFRDYEPSNIDDSRKSLAGRATHSMYFEILGDMGLWGLFCFFNLIWGSINLNREIKRNMSFIMQRAFALFSVPLKSKDSKVSNSIDQNIISEITYIENAARALLSSWAGLLVAAAGISVTYYPPLWLMVALSVSLWIYSKEIQSVLEEPSQ